MPEPALIYWIDPTGTEWRYPGLPDIPAEDDVENGFGQNFGATFGT